ncbi:hypothetical protein D0Z07_4037 [Hyphodiscus hymeniophilus]|uniref:Uncharacterized protein n=1 Tax=Hyphodiscus hymeniophilus TaxID=353542 RepID=A0A9P6VKF7_9HELO|nr:hypothetical protein D0Z07_4037 [Hyphodiscus hymeniophilus]
MFNYSYVDPNLLGTGFHILPFAYQARGISFADWADLFTLCLAPLIAHVFGGSPSITQLSPRRPRWHERLWQYNPTSILWRYFIIADRRLRAKSWSANQMAASNAYFWTAQGWDGSLQMMDKSRAFVLRLPAHHRVRTFSGSALTTVIITIQGVMAIKTLIDGIAGSGSDYSETINISSIFYPLAVFGLLRVFAALWLTDDYLYFGDVDSVMTNTNPSSGAVPSKQDPSLVETKSHTTMSLLDSAESNSAEQFHRTDSWRAIIFRIIYLVPVCCLLAICFLYVVPNKTERSTLSVTTFLMVLFYATFLGVSAFVFGFYFLSGRSTSSIIPCCNALWYKIYTAMLMTLTVVLVILACLETRKSPCGVYTTYPNEWVNDLAVCPHGTPVLVDHPQILGSEQVPFGLAMQTGINEDDTIDANTTGELKTVIISFEGICFGKFVSNSSNGAPVEALNGTFVPTTYYQG